MHRRLTPFLLLLAISLQGVFGALQGSVVICFGGGHEHAPAEVVEHCHLECAHHSEWPLPAAPDSDIDDCACTDVEVDLISMLATLTGTDYDAFVAPALSINVIEVAAPRVSSLRPPIAWPDPGLIMVRSTRLQV